MIFMVKSTVVRGRLLFLLATVLVWQRAVNRQPGSRARTRRAGASSLSFFLKFENFELFQKNLKNDTLVKKIMWIEL